MILCGLAYVGHVLYLNTYSRKKKNTKTKNELSVLEGYIRLDLLIIIIMPAYYYY